MSEDTLVKLKKKRGVIRGSITRIITKLETDIDGQDVDKLEENLELLNVSAEELKLTDADIEQLLKVEDFEKEITNVLEYREKITSWRFKTTKRIRNLIGKSQSDSSVQQVLALNETKTEVRETHNVKLPKLSISKFYGDISQWLSFWNSFKSAIHENNSLDKIEKFNYLKAYLGGSALSTIEGYDITPQNYDTAVGMLEERFGRKDMLINTHMNKLLNITPLKNSSDTRAFRKLLDNIQAQIRSLESLNVLSSTYGNILCPILLKVLPRDLVLEYNNQIESPNNDIAELIKFLTKRLNSIERTNASFSIINSQSQDQTYKQNFRKTDYFRNPEKDKQSVHRIVSANELIATARRSHWKQNTCIFCDSSDSHTSELCNAMKVDAKREKLKREGRCFLCLRRNQHRAFECVSKERCKYCTAKHNSGICYRRGKDQQPGSSSTETIKDDAATTAVSNYIGNEGNAVLLQTVKTEVVGQGQKEMIFCIYDNGSERTFIRKDISKRLNLKILGEEKLLIYTFQSKIPRQESCRRVLVTLRNIIDDREFVIEALEIDEISNAVLRLPDQNIKVRMQNKGIILTHSIDDLQNENKISLLIGTDNYWQLVTGRIERLNSHLVALETTLGWSIQGRVEGSNNCTSMNLILNEENISHELRQFWELENLGILGDQSNVDTQDQQILNLFNDSIRYVEGRYRVKLPWKSDMVFKLDSNKEVALKRFERLVQKFKNNPALYDEYCVVLNEYIHEGIIECSPSDQNKQSYFLPHRAVIREDKNTSRLRIVFDGSSHDRGELSLNDCIHSGPNLNPNILKLLIRFRQNAVALTADIKGAFLQIELDELDRDFTRFFWTDNLDLKEPKILNFTRVLFGLTSSPFLLAATLKHHFQKYKNEYPKVYEILSDSFYVDDFITGADEVEDAFNLSIESAKILDEASMLLRKFRTNSKELLELWKNSGIEIEESQNKLTSGDLPSKVLGLIWDSEKDEIRFDNSKLLEFISNRRNTKRFILQVVGRIFDPIGFLSPFIMRLKCLLQEIWCIGLKWDDEIPSKLTEKWQKWCNDAKDLNRVRITRYYFDKFHRSDIREIELHCFSDASKAAYGTVLYLRFILKDSSVHTSFVCSKNRVSPLKTLSLPRLELMGALLSSRLAKQVIDYLNFPGTLFYWTDSLIVIHWIKGNPDNFKLFVKNRVKEIQQLSDPNRWFYCPGKDNPADILSRGTSIFNLIENDLWWHGPSWLKFSTNNWPLQQIDPVNKVDLEYRHQVQINEIAVQNVEDVIDLNRYNNLLKILRITAWIKRYISKIKRLPTNSGPLTANEIHEAEKFWIKFVQNENYRSELESLKKNSLISVNSSIYSLAPFVDDEGLLRVKGRLEETDYSFDERKPIILPSKSKFTDLVVKDAHEKVLHGSVTSTLVFVRKRFWIPKGRQIVKKIVSRCLICQKYSAKSADQMTAQLPKDRVSETPPFLITGLDFTGPVFVKSGKDIVKSYITLFTCAVTRAIHLELVSCMSTSSFMLAFRRFVSRRGNCRVIYSDNAKTFKSAEKELQHFHNIIKDTAVKDFISTKGLEWKFIAERAPWWGGFYERLMKSIKEPLRKILGKALLSFEELTTLLTEIETVINQRPLTYVSNDIDELETLTPSHFLQFGRQTFEYPCNFSQLIDNSCTRESLTKRKQYQTNLLKQVWLKWKDNYLLSLKNAHKFKNPNVVNNLKVSDVVLVGDNSKKSKFLWDLGIITEILTGRDGLVRSCMVKTSKGLIRRPIQLLFPLEIQD